MIARLLRHAAAALAASVFFATYFNESPIGITYRIKGVSAADARILQQIAHEVVLGAK